MYFSPSYPQPHRDVDGGYSEEERKISTRRGKSVRTDNSGDCVISADRHSPTVYSVPPICTAEKGRDLAMCEQAGKLGG